MSKKGRLDQRTRKNMLVAGLFVMPNFLGFVAFVAFPVVFSLFMSFTNWTPMPAVELKWVGLANYRDLLGDRDFWFYSYNTVYFMLALPLSIAGSLVLAVLLSQRIRGTVAFRTLFYLPQFTSGVALIILWKTLYNKDFGLINACLATVFDVLRVSDASLPDWLGSTAHLLGFLPLVEGAKFGVGAREAIMIMGVWAGIGGTNMLLYLAGISNIPPELYEAAEIDGAGWRDQLRHVTWPQLAPTTFFIVVISVIGGLQGGFEQARVMTGGGPAGSTTTLSYYIYTKGFEELQFGYASSVAWVMFAMIFGLTVLNWRFGNRYVNN